MGDATPPDSLSDVIGRLATGKSNGGEYFIVADEQLIMTREECPDVLLNISKTPKIILVQRFSQHNKRLVSVEVVEKRRNSAKETCSTPIIKKNETEDLDITGSPLRCPFSVDDDISELSPFSISFSTKKKKDDSLRYTPLSASKAGLIASKFNLVLSEAFKEVEDHIWLWIVCDGKDAQNTLFYGLSRANEEVAQTVVTSSGPFNSVESLPSLDHLKVHQTAAFPTKRMDCSVKSTFDVLCGKDETDNSSVKLTCEWRRPLTILTPPSFDADTTACIKVVCSDSRSPAYQMYQELSVLKGFVKGLSTGEVSWFVREETNSVADDIEIVFSTIREKAQRVKKDDDGSANADMVEQKFYNRRQNLDFSDLLWGALMRCESYQDLKENLKMIFEAIMTGRVRPQIHVRNKTQIGKVARDLMRGQSAEFDLSGITPLQMLVEIGIEKIKRDYIHIFQAGELVTGDQLSWFVNNSDENLENMVKLLEKLHVGLQVMVISRTHLNLPLASLVHFTAQALTQLKEEESSSPYVFDFKLDTAAVHQLLKSMTPTTWEVTLDSSHENYYSKSLTCHISQKALIKFGGLNSDYEALMDEEEKENGEEVEEHYFCCFFTTVKDKTFF